MRDLVLRYGSRLHSRAGGRLTRARAQRRWPRTAIEPGVFIRGPLANLALGDGTNLQTACFIHLGGMDWCDYAGNVSIGRNGVVSPHAVIFGCGPGGVTIGDRFDCGPGVGIFASRTDYEVMPRGRVFAPVTIGDDVVIFANAVVNPGVAIGDGAAVAAGSVVLHDVPSATLVAGSPARVVRQLRAGASSVA